MKNLFKVSALVLGLVLGFSQVANAATTIFANNSTTPVVDAQGALFGNSIGAGITFNDSYTFKFDNAYDFTGVISATFAKAVNSFSSFGASLYDVTTNTSIGTFSEDSNGKFVFRSLDAANLAADTFRINVAGTTVGTANSNYTGSISVSPVPEAEEWAMMMLGLGMMGFVSRRKKA